MVKICVLRLGHRKIRDQRITTHVFLVARAFGADEGVFCGDEDASVIDGIKKVCELWGGKFEVRYEKSWKEFLGGRKKFGWKIVQLTMYGECFSKVVGKVRGSKIVLIVGAGKVPREIYDIADFNAAVTDQPHSEVAALALFLDRYFEGKEIGREFAGKMRVIPSSCGKRVVRV